LERINEVFGSKRSNEDLLKIFNDQTKVHDKMKSSEIVKVILRSTESN